MDDVRSAITANRPTFGTWVSTGGPRLAEMVGKAGYDWAVLDIQNGGIDWHQLLTSFQALDLGGTRALVRVGWSDPMQIMRALDLGALGVIVPMISTAEQAALAAQATRYPPKRNHSFGALRNHYGAPGAELLEPVFDAIDKVVAVCERHGVISGCATLGMPDAKALMERGVWFLTLGSEGGLIRHGAAADLAQVEQWLDPASDRPSSVIPIGSV